MGREVFEFPRLGGAARRMHERLLPGIEEEFPWDSLEPSPYPDALLERARIGWTENAFNEYCTAAALCQMLHAVMQARAPLELWTIASPFPQQEILHVELCLRIADRLGGAAPLKFNPRALDAPFEPTLSPFQRANDLVVRCCCVGEAFSMPMLRGCMDAASNPLTRAVLTRIVRDEVAHGRFGWLYLDWAAPRMDAAERDRLARIAARAIDSYRPIWENLHSEVRDGVTSEGFRIEHVHDMGWMALRDYQRTARRTLREEVIAPLKERGIDVRPHTNA